MASGPGINGAFDIPTEAKFLEDGGLLTTASGRLTGQELLDANRSLYATEEKPPAHVYLICDYRQVDEVDMSTSQIRAKDAEARQSYGRLLEIAADGDTVRPGLTRAQSLLGGADPRR